MLPSYETGAYVDHILAEGIPFCFVRFRQCGLIRVLGYGLDLSRFDARLDECHVAGYRDAGSMVVIAPFARTEARFCLFIVVASPFG
jgi:hypothetical protein